MPRLISRRAGVLIAVLIATAAWSAPAASSAATHPNARPQPTLRDEACDMTLTAEVTTIDGGKEPFSTLAPGTVLCLEAGTRPNLRIKDFHGAPGAPMLIRNVGGQVRITGELFGDGAIGIIGSSYLRVSGAGMESHCGAAYPADQQRCGIVIDGAVKGIKVNTAKGYVGDIELDHIEVLNVTTEKKTRGIAFHPIPGLTVSGIHVHHNHVVETLAEGIYIGSEPHNQPFETLGKVQHVEIDHNLVERTGYDGIKVKVGIRDISVHDNVIHDAGQLRDGAHQGGIKLALSTGDYYNNTVVGGVEGIRMGRDLDAAGTRYFNNVVVGALKVGIEASEDGTMVFNNTVISGGDLGIKTSGENTYVADNIVADTKRPILVRSGADVRNLVATDVAEVGFVNADDGDYRLANQSPALDAGVVIAGMPCGATDLRPVRHSGSYAPAAFDHDWNPRPAGCRTDLGAFERASTPPRSRLATHLRLGLR